MSVSFPSVIFSFRAVSQCQSQNYKIHTALYCHVVSFFIQCLFFLIHFAFVLFFHFNKSLQLLSLRCSQYCWFS